MKIYKSKNKELNTDSVVTIGTFDGVHLGHQKIVNQLINAGKEENLRSVILTFFPHPRMVLQKDTSIKLINTLDERIAILEKLGLDVLFIKKFTKDFSRLTAENFVKKILVDTLHAKKVIIGYDHRFGRNRNADIEDLKKFGDIHGFSVQEISAQDVNEVAVSSTKIRKALNDGDIAKANSFLGYHFMLTGIVTKGQGLGRQLGYRTANLYITEEYKLIPKQGSYIVSAHIHKKLYFGMMNIGMNPTVNGEKETIEVHFFDFDKDIYNTKIQVDLLHRLRDERKFESVEDLKKQLAKDKETAQLYIKEHHA